jgi:serine/threonine-protein kinase
MPSLPEVVRRLHSGTSAVDLDTEAGRAFLQDRVALYNKVTFLIAGGFFVAGGLMGVLLGAYREVWGLEGQTATLHLAALACSLTFWQVCRRRAGLPKRLLLVIDGASVALPVLGFSAQLFSVPLPFQARMTQVLVLVFTNMVILRAILVPATPVRTATVSLLASVPVVLALIAYDVGPPLDGYPRGIDRIWSLLWTVSALVVATLTSRVIYGLREEIREARRLGQYTLEEKLGEGGMGEVYRASHALLRRPTAIKLLPPDKAGEVALQRFEREVQLTSSLSHPNTISVFDYGRTPDGIFYYVMEYLDGTNLDSLVREDGPQRPGRVVHILEQVASALVEAHGVGLIHRDIKPENVILCERGGIPDVAKVLDFGLVKDLERVGDTRLTQANVVQGTPLYLSPEAINDPDAVDARSDIYSLGAVAYFLVTGSPVFTGKTLVEVCSHHLHSTPVRPSDRLGASVPPDLEELILACLEKQPADRPFAAAALRDALRSLDVPEWTDTAARDWWTHWRTRPQFTEGSDPKA